MGLDAGAMNLTVIVEEARNSSTGLVQQELTLGINHRTVDEIGGEGNYKVHTFPTPDQDAFRSTELVNSMAERVTAASEILQGTTSKSGTTATESTQAITAGARRLKVQSARCQRCNQEVFTMLWGMIRQFSVLPGDNGQVPQPVSFALTRGGDRIYGEISYDEMQVPVRLFAHGDTINTNEQLRLQTVEKVFMLGERSPFVTDNATRKYNLERYVLEAYGVRNISDMMGTIQEAQEKEDQAAQNPPPNQPPLPPNVNPEFLAAYIAANPQNPQVAAIVQSLAQVSAAQNTGKGGNSMADEQGNVLDPQGAMAAAKERIGQQEQMSKAKIEAMFKQKQMELDNAKSLALEQLKGHAERASMQQQHQHETMLMEQEQSADNRQRDVEGQIQQAKSDLQIQQQSVQHSSQLEKQKIAAAKATPSKPAANSTPARKAK